MSIWGRAMSPEVARALETPTKRKARTPRPKTGEAPGSPSGDGVAETGAGEADPTGGTPPEGETSSDAAPELPVVIGRPSLDGPVLGAPPPEFLGSPSEFALRAVAVVATVQLGAPDGARGSSGGTLQTGSADGPINVYSDVDTDDDSGDSDVEPDGSFAVGPASSSPSRIGGWNPRFTRRERPAWAPTAARGPVTGSTGRGRPDGMVGRVRRIFTDPRCSQVEVGGPPNLRPPPPRRCTASGWGTLSGLTGKAATCQEEPPPRQPL